MYPGDRPDKPNIAIILTDGVATVEAENTFEEARKLRDDGVVLFGIGIGAQVTDLFNYLQLVHILCTFCAHFVNS